MNNDLISREALKKKIEFYKAGHNVGTDYHNGIIDGYDFCIEAIDNAPAVEPKKVPVANVTFDADKLEEIVQTEVIEKIKSGDLVIKSEERPQAKWIHDGFCVTTTQYKCNKCRMPSLDRSNFCPYCGADMRVKDELNRVKNELEEVRNENGN